MLSGFRDFVFRGNIVDLAVAVVLGVAFANVVNSFVADILTPLLGLIGVPDFSDIGFTTPGGAYLAIGSFLNVLISFLLVAAAIYFFVVVPMNRLKGPDAVEMKTCTECASEIPLAARRCPMCTQPQPAEGAPATAT